MVAEMVEIFWGKGRGIADRVHSVETARVATLKWLGNCILWGGDADGWLVEKVAGGGAGVGDLGGGEQWGKCLCKTSGFFVSLLAGEIEAAEGGL